MPTSNFKTQKESSRTVKIWPRSKHLIHTSASMQYFQIPPTDALLAHNTIHNLTVGDRRPRTNPRGRPLQPAIGRSAYESADNVHCSHALTTAGAWRLARYGLRFTATPIRSAMCCPPSHFAKFRLASINPKFRRCSEVHRSEPAAQPRSAAERATHSNVHVCMHCAMTGACGLAVCVYQTEGVSEACDAPRCWGARAND